MEKLQKIMEKMTYESLKEGSIKETTEKEFENILLELFWNIFLDEIYKSMYSFTIFWLKILLFLFIVYQILDNITKYIDSRGIRFRSPIYTDEDS